MLVCFFLLKPAPFLVRAERQATVKIQLTIFENSTTIASQSSSSLESRSNQNSDRNFSNSNTTKPTENKQYPHSQTLTSASYFVVTSSDSTGQSSLESERIKNLSENSTISTQSSKNLLTYTPRTGALNILLWFNLLSLFLLFLFLFRRSKKLKNRVQNLKQG